LEDFRKNHLSRSSSDWYWFL